jgi:hypothetical protein
MIFSEKLSKISSELFDGWSPTVVLWGKTPAVVGRGNFQLGDEVEDLLQIRIVVP